jgi:Universal stress protein family
MQRFKNILVYTEGDSRSRAVLERASALATRNKARPTVLSVLESLPRELQRLGAAVDLAELWEVAVSQARHGLAIVATAAIPWRLFHRAANRRGPQRGWHYAIQSRSLSGSSYRRPGQTRRTLCCL